MADDKKVLFVVNGQQVDGLGRVDGKAASQGPTVDVAALQREFDNTKADFVTYQNDLPGLKARVAELEAANDGPQEGDTDQRTKAQLSAALTEKGVAYDAKANRPALLALAAEHGV